MTEDPPFPVSDGFYSEAREEITGFIEERVEDAGLSGAVVAMSGGIDSSLTAALAAEALGPERVHGIGLPQGGTSRPSALEDARSLAEELGIEFGSTDVASSVEALEREGRRLAEGTKRALINLAPRARMALTYFVANAEEKIVLGTGNRSEILLGYFTKHGDGAADLLPIGDLYKTQVRGLGERMGLPERILEKEPSAGLYEGQTDAEELGHPYPELDPVLHLLYVEGREPEEVAERTRLSTEEVERVLDRVLANRHKRTVPETPGIENR